MGLTDRLRRPAPPPPPAPDAPSAYGNLNEILTDSYSPALILPKRSEDQPAYKIYYSHLRHVIAALAAQAPFSHCQPRDVITFLIPNSLENVAVFFATTSVRAIANPLNPSYTAEEIAYYLKDVGSKAVVVPQGDKSILENVKKAVESVGGGIPIFEVFADVGQVLRKDRPVRKLREKRVAVIDPVVNAKLVVGSSASSLGRPVQPEQRGAPVADDVALMLHTSGTTGRPKGVPLSHGNILRTLKNIEETYRLSAGDTSYLVMPLFHVHGLIGALLSTFHSGGTVVVPPKFSVTHFWTDFIEHGATWYSAVPTIHQMLLLKAKETYKGNSGKLRFIRSCSSSLAPATLFQLEKTFRAPVIEAYAMSEAAHQMTANFLPPGMRKPGSVGKGRGVEVRILDGEGKPVKFRATGEVCIRGANVITAYHNNEKATAESFFSDSISPSAGKWFRTGDLGYIDEMGFLFLVGRIKEQINRGGEKISPIEIDQVLLQCRGVGEAVTFGVDSAVYGQEIEAAVVAKDEYKGKLKEADVIAHAKKSLAAFKVPRKIHVVDAVPKTATGKVQRGHVADAFAAASKAKL
ncbi:hypothetical protein PhCBS80983_g03229 [Powellomyces hirtus]|uniref:AMP-dependent synthetase/ligase domain-containing protein n=1 Tax=Powellomyces hirtus TaxID=109895 RepID=A0A507E5B3_9FUNG|nr:hypothetical protein PhCBS80983_g03229 [Powellomyces hirtus]